MIRLVKKGHYKLLETKRHTKILLLDKRTYAWISIPIGDILVISHIKHAVDHILSLGVYRLYDVKDEPKLTDLLHLDLFIGDGKWQGYLLPTGLPTNENKRNRIISTDEIITKSTH